MNIVLDFPPYFAPPSHGGVFPKVERLNKEFQALGHRTELFNKWSTDLGGADIYHHFGSFPAFEGAIRYARRYARHVVVESIYEVHLGFVLRLPDLPVLTRARAMAHLAVKRTFPYVLPQRRLLMNADMIMALSEREAGYLVRHFRVPRERIWVVPNGVDEGFASGSPELFEEEYGLGEFVLAVGTLEPRKNFETLIAAMKGTGVPLVIIGRAPKWRPGYAEKLKRMAGAETVFIEEYVSTEMLRSAYSAAGAFVMPSWTEAQGKVALEAGLAGAPLVLTEWAPSREYFGEFASYIVPSRRSEMRRIILETLGAGNTRVDEQRDHILRNFSWRRAAEKRLEGFARLLTGENKRAVGVAS